MSDFKRDLMSLRDVVTASEFCQVLSSDAVIGHFRDGTEFLIGSPEGGGGVPVKVLSKPESGVLGSHLVVTFHGAVDQKSRTIPVFYGDQVAKRHGKTATVLSIADPSLRLSDEMLSAWYGGDYAVRTQDILAEVFFGLNNLYKPSKIVFLGGSSGAHPALYHSHKIKNSICLVANPLPRIRGYYQKSVDLYLSSCWPSLGESEVFDSHVFDDLGGIYRSGHENYVIILQNCFDHHIYNQVVPFVASFGSSKKALFLSEFFDSCIGHNYPSSRWMEWIGVVLNENSPDLIKMAASAASNKASEGGLNIPKDKNNTAMLNQRDVNIAARLASDIG